MEKLQRYCYVFNGFFGSGRLQKLMFTSDVTEAEMCNVIFHKFSHDAACSNTLGGGKVNVILEFVTFGVITLGTGCNASNA